MKIVGVSPKDTPCEQEECNRNAGYVVVYSEGGDFHHVCWEHMREGVEVPRVQDLQDD